MLLRAGYLGIVSYHLLSGRVADGHDSREKRG
jgi:hypothetical protein